MVNGSRSRRSPRRGGSNGKFGQLVFGLLVLGALFAFFQIPSDPSVSGVWNVAVDKSKTVEIWAKETANKILGFDFSIPDRDWGSPGGGSGGEPSVPGGEVPSGPVVNVDEAMVMLDSLKVEENKKVNYDRGEWSHWKNIRSCWNVREQVLATQAVTVVLKDKDGRETSDINSACEVVSGKWVDPYTGVEFTNPSELDIDHMVPLKKAAVSGGQGWDKDRKAEFANDLSYPNHLLAVSAGANRSKSDKGPGTWKPDNQGYWCEYAVSWITVSKNYGLTVNSVDKDGLVEMLGKCS